MVVDDRKRDGHGKHGKHGNPFVCTSCGPVIAFTGASSSPVGWGERSEPHHKDGAADTAGWTATENTEKITLSVFSVLSVAIPFFWHAA